VSDYVYSLNGQDDWDDYDSIMLRFADENEGVTTGTIFRGTKKTYTHADFITPVFAGVVIDKLMDEVWEVVGEEANDCLSGITSVEIAELTKYMLKWFNRHVKQPSFYLVENVEEITVDVEVTE
jgi:hypothetical protein